jgi:hypothetical protein
VLARFTGHLSSDANDWSSHTFGASHTSSVV